MTLTSRLSKSCLAIAVALGCKFPVERKRMLFFGGGLLVLVPGSRRCDTLSPLAIAGRLRLLEALSEVDARRVGTDSTLDTHGIGH